MLAGTGFKTGRRRNIVERSKSGVEIYKEGRW